MLTKNSLHKMNTTKKIEQKLQVLLPETLEIYDETAKHASHFVGKRKELTHLKIVINSPLFRDKPMVMQHKMVKDLLQDEFKQGLHALSIKIIKNYGEENVR